MPSYRPLVLIDGQIAELPADAGFGLVQALFDFVTDATTTGTASETLYDGEIAANTLINNGEAIKIEAAGTFAANTNTKIIWCEVGGTQIGDAGTGVTSNGKDWVLDGLLIREDADTMKYYIEQTVDGETVKTDAGKINSLDFTAAIDFTFRGRTPTNAGDLTAYFWKAYKLPAAPVVEQDIIDGGNSTAAYTDIIDGGNSTAAYTDIIDGGAS